MIENSATVTFPVEAHVQKYLIKRYGAVHVATKTTLLGMMVMQGLTNHFDKPEKTIKSDVSYTILIGEFYINTKGHSVGRNMKQYLAVSCTKMFNEHLYDFLDMMVEDGHKAMPSLKKFLGRYGITEDDVKVESQYKAYQRHCDMKIKAKKFVVPVHNIIKIGLNPR